ncbi:helix-turn-helix transcriptional regulator [Chryseobacterium arthrosphaerae]|uniref:helix-turn-helix transcriptional regulator n=1 Tax=Chryseobacterium arthrosphaerae TaxID=651561 RepID=UPI001BAFF1CA|nr:hypothetical protein [Chryseobacterium arthrosphaerae]QUY56220.1 hypothetical protein I2F65_02385 [Chryseobacterium arthrosphaerae]
MFILTFISFTVYGQTRKKACDSLKALISNSYKKDIFDNHKDILRYSTELYYISKSKNDQQSILFSLFEQSRIYFMENKYGVTLKKLKEGIILAKKMHDYNMLCRFLLIYQKVLVHLDYSNHEIKTLINKSTELNKQVKNNDDRNINTIYILVAQADSYLNNEGLSNNMKNVIALKTQAYKESLKIKEDNPLKTFTQIYALQSLSWSCALARNFKEADYYLSITDSLLTKNPNYYFNVDCLITKGAIENIKRNHLKAIEYFQQAIDKSEKSQAIFHLYTVYPMISASYGEIKDYQNAMTYSWKAKDKSENLQQLRIEGHNPTIITNINHEINTIGEQKYSYYMYIIAGLLVTLSASSYYFLNKKKKNKKAAPMSLTSQYADTVHSSENNTPENDAEDNKKLVNLAKEDINTFYIEFEKNYPSFQFDLKKQFPELNLSDINFCSLIKMKFDIKQIATYTNTTLRSVESRRYRIRKKMELKGQDDLYIIISNIG